MKLAVYTNEEQYISEIMSIAKNIGIPVIEEKNLDEYELVLKLDSRGLTLTGNGLEVRGDFTRMLPRLKTSNLRNELLVKAAKLKSINISDTSNAQYWAIDATAGLGEDAILLAAAGFNVRMYEYNPVIAELLKDALKRASKNDELSAIVERMNFIKQDSIEALNELDITPEVVLLDPMFPARQKSALVKKKFQLLQHLEQPCSDEQLLLDAALKAHPKKILIKRPSKGPNLAGVKPSYSIEGKGIRYDCIICF